MAAGFSILSIDYFVDGLDRGLNGTMYEVSQSTEAEAGKTVNILGFNVASRWQDTPNIIQEKFAIPPTNEGELYKYKEQESIFLLPDNLYFVVLYKTPSGENRFISKVILEQDLHAKIANTNPTQRLLWVTITAIIAIALFAFMLIMIMQKIAKPIESLRNWARQLNSSNIDQSPPDFSYAELNTLAELVRGSLLSAHESLVREQKFLSYASHELRTPISVIRSNVDLLKKLHEKFPLTDKQANTLARIERAGLTMSDLTETLLWLSRNDEHANEEACSNVNLYNEVMQLTTELKYLLSGKNVQLNIIEQAPTGDISTYAVACHIVLSNLIRNAYQHTQEGEVSIYVAKNNVRIINKDVQVNAQQIHSNNHQALTGYGLGLELSEKIISRYAWSYNVTEAPGSYEVSIDFAIKHSLSSHD